MRDRLGLSHHGQEDATIPPGPQRIRDRLAVFHLDPNAHSCASYG
jgi:hypothetical protein